MQSILDFLSQPWPWYASGAVIAFVMILLFFFGKTFGFSSNFRTICALSGGGKQCEFFDFNWRDQIWNLLFLVGSVIGGVIASVFLSGNEAVALSDAALNDLAAMGIAAPEGLQPKEIFSWESLFTLQGFVMLVVGGFLVGFGSRYAGGCTSGHAITGLSTLQLPSLVAVIGFFIGGLFTTWVVLPWLLG
jgi:uncharacterized membrane protein YedE/YeeE